MSRTTGWMAVLLVCVFFIAPAVAYAQGENPAANTNQAATPAGATTQTSASNAPSNNLREGLKAMNEGSRTLVGWCLVIIAASVAAIVSTSYLRPLSLYARLMYLLYIFGWLCLALSIYYGDKVSRRAIAAVFSPDGARLSQIGFAMNSDFDYQRGLFFFAVWLLIYLLWWIFWYKPPSVTTAQTGGTR